ncbi:MAG: hypothetical protein H7Y62_14745 [Hyphomicrobium sp.]|nr:hypothetical protein [Hyphomicrobium sp.]
MATAGQAVIVAVPAGSGKVASRTRGYAAAIAEGENHVRLTIGIIAALWLGAGMPGLSRAQAPAVNAPPSCAAPEHRQFDFWLGAWEVTDPKGKALGSSRIEAILDDCVLLENWNSASGFTGRSFNLYNRDTGKWEQFWVDQSGARLHLSGGLVDGAMVLRGVQDKPKAETKQRQHERITWTPSADGSVRQLWETSKDDGKTWVVSFDGMYRRPPKALQDG